MTQHRWTEQEIADLVRLYPDKSILLAQLEQHFGRRKGTIKQQARRLDLRRPNREWSEQDIAELIRQTNEFSHHEALHDDLSLVAITTL